jgi:hypothetical protein
MREDDARAQARQALDAFFRLRNLDPADRVTSLSVTPKVDQHFSIGLSGKTGDGGCGIEVRLRRQDGLAARFAAELNERFGDAVSISTLGRIAIPSMASLSQAGAAAGFGAMLRPLALGGSVAHRDAMAGSIGPFVRFERGPFKGRKGLVSNAHVLALSGLARAGDPIYQPAKPDVKSLLNSLRVGELADFTALSAVGAQELDAAVAALDENALADEPNRLPKDASASGVARLGAVVEPRALRRHDEVCKIGRSTGLTTGLVTATELSNLSVFSPQLKRNIRFDNVVEISWLGDDKPFAGPGDSGSLIWRRSDLAPVALLFAGGVRERDGKKVGVGYACSLAATLQSLGASMLT